MCRYIVVKNVIKFVYVGEKKPRHTVCGGAISSSRLMIISQMGEEQSCFLGLGFRLVLLCLGRCVLVPVHKRLYL